MQTPKPWKVGKQQSDGTWCVVTPNHVAEGITHTDDKERYGGSLVAKGLTLANARLVACAPDMHKLIESLHNDGVTAYCDECDEALSSPCEVETGDILQRIFTGAPA